MKLDISDNTVRKLIFMLSDFTRMDAGQDEDHQMWSDFDFVAIEEDLYRAIGGRDENGMIEVSEATIQWLAVLLENYLPDRPRLISKKPWSC